MSFVLRRGAGYDDGNLKAKFRGSGTAEGREKSQGHWTRAKAGLEARKYAHVLGAAYDPLNFGGGGRRAFRPVGRGPGRGLGLEGVLEGPVHGRDEEGGGAGPGQQRAQAAPDAPAQEPGARRVRRLLPLEGAVGGPKDLPEEEPGQGRVGGEGLEGEEQVAVRDLHVGELAGAVLANEGDVVLADVLAPGHPLGPHLPGPGRRA